MSRRRINLDAGEPELTYPERMFIGEYIKNGGNGKDAAIAAGYGPAHADQSAPQAQNADPRAETSPPSPGNPQPAPAQQLKPIGRQIQNLRKINLTQCLDPELQHAARPCWRPKTKFRPAVDLDGRCSTYCWMMTLLPAQKILSEWIIKPSRRIVLSKTSRATGPSLLKS